MALTLVNDPIKWNTMLAALPNRHVLQSWEWGQFKSRWGWQPRYFVYGDGQAKAAALVLRRSIARGLNILYVPKGPAMNYSDAALADRVLNDLIEIAKRDRAIFIKIDPDLDRSDRAILLDQGWRESAEQIQFRNTVLIDLTPTEDQLLAAMKPKTRYNIRIAQKKGVSARLGGVDDLDRLYALYDETAQRDGFIIRPIDYYRDAWGSFIRSGLAQPFVAEVEHEAVAALILFRFADRAWYMYGMSRNLHREFMPNHLLQWEALRWAKAHGCALYDLWGAPDELNESDPMWGVYKFKEGLGGRFTQHVGAVDFVVSRWGYWLYSVAMPRVLNVMRRKHRAGQSSSMAARQGR
jgi:peptidoglycan pentaglycine glycine transferase (the first glycine)